MLMLVVTYLVSVTKQNKTEGTSITLHREHSTNDRWYEFGLPAFSGRSMHMKLRRDVLGLSSLARTRLDSAGDPCVLVPSLQHHDSSRHYTLYM